MQATGEGQQEASQWLPVNAESLRAADCSVVLLPAYDRGWPDHPASATTPTTALQERDPNSPINLNRRLRNPSRALPSLLARLKVLDNRFKARSASAHQSSTRDNAGRYRPHDCQPPLQNSFQHCNRDIIADKPARVWIGPPKLQLTLPADSGEAGVGLEEAMAALVHHHDSDVSSIHSISERLGPSDSEPEDKQKYIIPDNARSRGSSRNAFMFEGSSFDPNLPPTPPPKDPRMASRTSLVSDTSEPDAIFFPSGLSKAGSIYTLGRASFTDQISQLTSIKLPEASSLSTSIAAIPTSAAAARALNDAADQIRRWVQKASDVIGGLDAEDEVEWAAAGGREGVDEVDTAITRFEQLVDVYVTAVEDLERRDDMALLTARDLKAVVDRMERITVDWAKIKDSLERVKEQVRLALEWEELWNAVLGQIRENMDTLNRHVFEMEERRHRNSLLESIESGHGIDIQALETIVEEAPSRNPDAPSNNRLSIIGSLPGMPPSSQAEQVRGMQEETNLLALFAQLQPLEISMEFARPRLTQFLERAKDIFPTGCDDLEKLWESLRSKYKKLEVDADSLRQELGEDRWVLMFRKAGSKTMKMCESVERSITKLRDELDDGTQHTNPPSLAQRIDNYEAKKLHYKPAIQRVLEIIDRGVQSRSTVNGEILRLQADLQRRWTELESQTKGMDFALEQLNINKTNALRDSVSTILSAQGSVASSTGTTLLDTPGSSPASSVVFLSRQSSDQGTSTPYAVKGKSRASSFASSTTLPSSKRLSSLPVSGANNLTRKTPLTRSSVADLKAGGVSSRLYPPPSPSRSLSRQENSREDKPSRPRWNSSTNLNDTPIGHNFKPSTTPSPYKRSLYLHGPRSVSTPTAVSHPSPLGQEFSSSTISESSSLSRPPVTPLGSRIARPPSALGDPLTASSSRLPRASIYFTPGSSQQIPSSPPSSLRSSTASALSNGSTSSVRTVRPSDSDPLRDSPSTPKKELAQHVGRPQSSIQPSAPNPDASPSAPVRPLPAKSNAGGGTRPASGMARRRSSMLPLPRSSRS